MIPSRSWLVLDMHYLCHRAFHVMDGSSLSWDGNATSIVFSVLKSLGTLCDDLQSDRFVFCFDSRHKLREQMFPGYKQGRREKQEAKAREFSAAERAAHADRLNDFHIQVQELRRSYLSRMGFCNVLYQDGMEGDDMMAAFARSRPKTEHVVLITADNDLMQCLRSNVSVYNPTLRKLMERDRWVGQWGLKPTKWARVKAIAGCSSDSIPGIRGVGNATAARYLRRELNCESKAYQAITSPEGRAIIQRNLPLVRLPLVGCTVPEARSDRVSLKRWREVCASMGMGSIAGRPPLLNR